MDDEQGQSLAMGPVDIPEFLRPTYANFVNVNHTPWDFRLTFAVVRAPLPGAEAERAVGAGAVHADAVADIILPANLMHGLISALQENFTRYLDLYGAPGLNPEGPRNPDEEPG